MTESAGEHRYQLDQAESDRIFRDRIVPDRLTGSPQQQPIVVFVCGQPGDGKATVTKLAEAVLRRRGRPVILSAPAFEAYHPRLYEPITDVPTTADKDVQPDGRRWLAAAEALTIQQRYDGIVETELLDPSAFAESARRFKAAGFQVEIAVLAVHEAQSRLGVLERHMRALEEFGFGRLTPPARHDAGYQGVLRAAELIDTGDFADRAAVLRPDGRLIYGNQRDGRGQWQQPPRTGEAVSWERERPWTVPESRHFLDVASEVGRIGLAAPVQWVRDESVGQARAVTALARRRLHPDAVTLHIATAGTLG
ncbi:zeta toxin family protein [Kribbella sp. CA-293567]|uniref:zeta toxin family protein n=1 Tax=Kribbella sp. CA-293567 TaxID=3002436 RepID=UPI0022DE0668|nr:zeta toxin family protein [Kribbella sp. CA-293567]WBQ06480.1 zeta toxin family protein [Kribbella sp. CA-293567]